MRFGYLFQICPFQMGRAPKGQRPMLQHHFSWKKLSLMAGMIW
jgi:hypothetical protein